MLPDEIVSEILSPALTVPEDLFSDTSGTSPFADYTPSTSAYLLVCKDWLRVGTPLLYNVVVLRSKAQTIALAVVLKDNPEFGRFIKKLRVEGGYGAAMQTILKSAPNVTDLCLSLSIWSSDSTNGLCKGLSLVDPHRFIVVDPIQDYICKNKQSDALRQSVLACIRSTWQNLRIFVYPYGGNTNLGTPEVWIKRAQDLSEALLDSRVHTIALSGDFWSHIPAFIHSLCGIPSLQLLEFQHPMNRYDHFLISQIDTNPLLKKLAKYTLRTTEVAPNIEPDIAPSLNPNFIPMGSATEETREVLWRRVLYFAMRVEERRFSSERRRHGEVSKYFHRLGLVYMYDSIRLDSPSTCGALQKQLEGHPQLGSFIRYIFTDPSYDFRGPIYDALFAILKRTTHLEVFVPLSKITRRTISMEILNLMGQTAGKSIRKLATTLEYHQVLSVDVFEPFEALSDLAIGGTGLGLAPTQSGFPSDALKRLHTLCIFDDSSGNFFRLFTNMRLQSLRSLSLPYYIPDKAALTELLAAHGPNLVHLIVAQVKAFKLLDFCPNLLDVQVNRECDLRLLIPSAPHNTLSKIIIEDFPAYIDLKALLKFDSSKFPALREIQLRRLRWPITEHEISKSLVVPFAESLLQKNIQLVNVDGKDWTPRLKAGFRVHKS
ncbi:hypothetical protein FB45DRAFT_1051003 [Roridomyces roridus]|uniref:Uncharacterized protein n=1 Tax=Roridomyces roridus TaxID=1738132 RepID=A0AAD7CKR4_9AGAR|nr:hypothetical protein FB45DRAFT_1051003 [Roridomyces roridus]